MRTFLVWTLRVTISPWNSLPTLLKEPMLAMSFLLGCSSPRPPRPRWRSTGRGRSATHPGTDRSRAEDAVAKTLLPREEWASAQGKKVDSDGVAAQAIEAQPFFGQIKPKRGQALSCLQQHPREKTWRISIAKNKGAQRTGAEKEPVAQKRDASLRDRSAAHR